MKPEQIYALSDIGSEWDKKNISSIFNTYINHIPEIEEFDFDYKAFEQQHFAAIFLIKTHFDPYIDGRRVCQIKSVWYRSKPVMIIRNGGREGSDSTDRFITDKDQYLAMVKYLLKFKRIEDNISKDFHESDKNVKELDYFYGNFFEIVNDEIKIKSE